MEETIYIDGVASSQSIDTAGERLSMEGHDISSLAVDGIFTWEHNEAVIDGKKVQINLPYQVVGKILKAKKIFSEQDCEDDRQRYYWDKVKTPFVYVMGALFNKYTESARHVAGMFRYDADHRDSNKRNVLSFSVEGGKLPGRDGITVLRSIARKVTIAVHPANHQAFAEMIPNPKAAPKDDLDSLFKTCQDIEIELLKSEQILNCAEIKKSDSIEQMQKSATILGIDPMAKTTPLNKSMPGTPKMTTETHGGMMGATKSGKQIFSHAKVHEYTGFSAADHKEAAGMHHAAASRAGVNSGAVEHHLGKMKLHLGAAKTSEDRSNRFARGVAANMASRGMAKSLEAGSTNASPGSLVGGAALQKESIQKPLQKIDWLARSEQEYTNWSKKEKFVEFMKSERKDLTLTEIEALGKTLALSESLKMEEKLANLVKK